MYDQTVFLNQLTMMIFNPLFRFSVSSGTEQSRIRSSDHPGGHPRQVLPHPYLHNQGRGSCPADLKLNGTG